MSNFKRYAIVGGTRKQIEPYLPSNYTVAGEVVERTSEFSAVSSSGQHVTGERIVTVIEGRDNAGWTLDGYVIPRLASGLHFANEVGLDHPVFKLIPEVRS